MNDRKDIRFDKRADKYDEGFEGRLSEKLYKTGDGKCSARKVDEGA